MTANLFYIARLKDDYICFILAGPYFNEEVALAELAAKHPQDTGRCRNAVVQQIAEFEEVE